MWIGGTDADSEGTWKWSPSGTLVSYTNWAGSNHESLTPLGPLPRALGVVSVATLARGGDARVRVRSLKGA